MTSEETNKLYKKAFRCITYSIDKDKNILSRIKEFVRLYDYLEIPQPVNVISQEERESYPHLTLDQIAELKAKDHSGIYAFLKVETIFQKIKKDVIDIKGKQKQIFERLKKSVEKEKYVINQVQDLKRNRIIGVIGKDHSLIRGIVTYLWLTHPTNSNKLSEWLSCKTPLRQCICSIIGKHIPERIDFLYVPCKGLNETEIKKLLPQIQDKRLNGIETRMVFLGDINCDSRNNVLNMLVGMVEDGFIRKRNIVISMDTLPTEFEDQFEPIYLEPKKQDTPASTPNGNLFLREGDYWTIQYKDKLIRLKHCKGLDYIAYLLENVNKDLWAYEVVQVIDKDQFQKDCIKIKDKKSKNDFFDESDACEEGLGIIKDSGLNEKYRKRISASIGRALRNIKKQDKDLWQHLNSAINQGKNPSYTPKEPQNWTVKR